MKFILSTLCFILIATYSTFGQVTIGDPPPSLPEDSLIIGTWILIEDAKSKWAFTPDSLHQYYDDKLTGEYSYSIQSSPPASNKCGKILSQNPNPDLEYLVLEEFSSSKYYCYIVNGLSKNYLTINPIRTGHFLRFEKPK